MNIRLTTLTLITVVFSMTSLPSYGANVAPMLFFDRPEVIYPVPTDEDVILNLGQASRRQLPPKTFKFLVWNLHKGADETFKPEFLALAFDRDIVMAQEMFLDKKMLNVFRYLPQFYQTTATSFFSGKQKIRTGVSNMSTVLPEFTDFVRSVTLEPVVHSPKVALINSYPIYLTTKKLTVVNIHGINFVSNQNFRSELNRIYEKIKNIPPPIVFAGDFNTWNKDRIEILEEVANKLKLSEATFLPDNRMTFNGYPLDHFYFSADLKIKKARVDIIYKGSDHKPLQVEVEYSPQQSDIEYDYDAQVL